MKRILRHMRSLVCALLIGLMATTSLMAEDVVPIVLKVGLQNQVGGCLTVTETEAGMFQKGDLNFTVVGQESHVYLTDVKVETTGGIKGVTSKVIGGQNGRAKVTLSRASKKAASITLKDFKFTVDRTVPEGVYDLEISGSAITSDSEDKLVIKGFIKIGTPSCDESISNKFTIGTTNFNVDQKVYKTNNHNMPMDSAPYMQGNECMVPVKYVVEALGIKKENLTFNNNKLVVFTGFRTITLTVGSKEATVNGANVDLVIPVQNVEGRIYVAGQDIAQLVGVGYKWDIQTKTAYFINE